MRQITSVVALGAILIGSMLLGGAGSTVAAQGGQPKVPDAVELKAVLELYTSQGCSSCPPADALMEGYAGRKDLLALSFPVDYWDYLGWKDTLASPKFSARQRAYSKERGDGRVYTPQMVVSGRTHVTGSSAASIDRAIEATKAEFERNRIPVKISSDKAHVVIETGDAPPSLKVHEATIWMAMVRREVEVQIQRGENRGRKIKYYNVVRDLSPVGMWSGKAGKLTLARDALTSSGNELCAVVIQAGKAGPIIGAAALAGL